MSTNAERMSGLLASREAGRLGPSFMPIPVERALFNLSEAKKCYKLYKDMSKYGENLLEEQDFAEAMRDSIERTVAMRQGKYENQVVNTDDPDKYAVQTKYNEQVSPIEKPSVEVGGKQHSLNPEDIVQEIAEFENLVFDRICNTLRSEAKNDVSQKEVEKQMDQVIRTIGVTFLRGSIPGPIGDYFKRKASSIVEQFTADNNHQTMLRS